MQKYNKKVKSAKKNSIFAFDKKRKMKISKNRYLQGFGIIVVILAIIRCACPQVAEQRNVKNHQNTAVDSLVCDSDSVSAVASVPVAKDTVPASPSRFFKADGSMVKNRILSVPNFGNAFPDQNDVQLVAANKYGVKPVTDGKDAEKRKNELTYVGSNPYFYVDRLRTSIPYLVPRASVLLQDIGRNFFDSLQTKGVPLHKIIVTSVMRSKEDVKRLRTHNQNATENSCHLYGTTFDICYNRYKTVEAPGEHRRVVTNDTLKWILSEVLNDMRKQQRCLVKYEVHQGCFHITVN
jgi:hypothetical protein